MILNFTPDATAVALLRQLAEDVSRAPQPHAATAQQQLQLQLQPLLQPAASGGAGAATAGAGGAGRGGKNGGGGGGGGAVSLHGRPIVVLAAPPPPPPGGALGGSGGGGGGDVEGAMKRLIADALQQVRPRNHLPSLRKRTNCATDSININTNSYLQSANCFSPTLRHAS